jgi:hypothetical protein
MRGNISGRGTPDREGALLVRRSLWCFACFLLAGRSRIPARREGVLEANSVFSPLIRESSGLREPSGSCRTRTRSLPALGPSAATRPREGTLHKKNVGEVGFGNLFSVAPSP